MNLRELDHRLKPVDLGIRFEPAIVGLWADFRSSIAAVKHRCDRLNLRLSKTKNQKPPTPICHDKRDLSSQRTFWLLKAWGLPILDTRLENGFFGSDLLQRT
jgi:hypothetical protein